ncbi:hypothetical protein phiOC_p305 [Ochrobactrum phage vB_OspM_OC]|nr:hypothetical protein phiOC_p305 [Ochrobactrum phage vB_OspM_OC]
MTFIPVRKVLPTRTIDNETFLFETDFDKNSHHKTVPFKLLRNIFDTSTAKINMNEKDSFYKDEVSLTWYDPKSGDRLARMTINVNGFRSLTQIVDGATVTLNLYPVLNFASITIDHIECYQKFYIRGEKQYEFCETLFNWIVLEHKKLQH